MIPTITFVMFTINIKGKYETAVIHQDKAKGKTCMRRRDKTFLRAPVPAGLMHARQWVTGLHLAGQTTGDGGGWVGGGLSGGPLQKGVIAAFMHAASSYLVQ